MLQIHNNEIKSYILVLFMENEHFLKEKCAVYFDRSVSFICTYKHFSIFNAIRIILYTICLAKLCVVLFV